ncbi:hypothetical protein CE131_12045 [Vibrio parahaemolyticus]|uniref:Polysaccharide polymerase n=1 Tax=Vibrio parahaemolyticus TaxID=670 RepID=A0A5P5X4T6_VIBPH|nr:hypothetical protein [Vibrio parahaemolyticus]EGQ7661893.1 hypothetical protein [Vibrio parahaemolyticus]KOY23532.1 hypothetical protein ACX12_15040 [Vibrio parahaemolyticus]KYY12429.1 hypothetical protein AWQ10_08550 [Vibrio parahaemolyticus]OXD57687.1 hypothetical protein CE131_12045 [Vibrio parahaemolyticus]OXD63581.1 hypothetical protein CA154_12045 [Vibrio parahaemolyticus]
MSIKENNDKLIRSFMILIYSLPAVAIKLIGNIPIRYTSIIYMLLLKKVNRDSTLLLISIYLYILNMIIGGFFSREASFLDISYILAFLACFVFVNFCYKSSFNLDKWIKIFLIVNLSYALSQTLLLYIGVPSKFLLLHQNIKTDAYVIPPTLSYLPMLYRYTGLFHESAPFVIYLMFNYIYFSLKIDRKENKKYKIACLIGMLFSGAKVGLLFIFYLVFSKLIAKVKVRVGWFIIIGVFSFPFLVVIADSILKEYVTGTSIGSLYIRFRFMTSTFDDFFGNLYPMLFGYGVVPSNASFEQTRGLDFFSIFLYGNGILGAFFILFPISMHLRKLTKNISLREKNLISVALFLSLITSGALTIIQYTYLLAYLSIINRKKSENICNSACIQKA